MTKNIVDLSSFHILSDDEIRDNIDKLNNLIKLDEEQESELQTDKNYQILKRFFKATTEDIYNKEFTSNEIYMYFYRINEISDKGYDYSYPILAYSKLFNDFDSPFLYLDIERALYMTGALLAFDINPANYKVAVGFLMDDDIYNRIKNKFSRYNNSDNLMKGFIEDTVYDAFNTSINGREGLKRSIYSILDKIADHEIITHFLDKNATIPDLYDKVTNDYDMLSALGAFPNGSIIESKKELILEIERQNEDNKKKFLECASITGDSDIGIVDKLENIVALASYANNHPEIFNEPVSEILSKIMTLKYIDEDKKHK